MTTGTTALSALTTLRELPEDVVRRHVATRLGIRDIAALSLSSWAGNRASAERMQLKKELSEHFKAMRCLAWLFDSKHAQEFEDYGWFVEDVLREVGDSTKIASRIGPALHSGR